MCSIAAYRGAGNVVVQPRGLLRHKSHTRGVTAPDAVRTTYGIAFTEALCCLQEHVGFNNADCPQQLVEFVTPGSYSIVVCHV